MRLSFHPWADNGFPSLGRHGLVANHGLLDAFAREFANNPRLTNNGEMRRSDPEMQDFFLIWLPNRLFNITAGLETAPENYQLDMSTAEGMGTAQWLAHLGGYYAAVWLRACWTEFEGERPNIAMRDRKFHAIYKRQLDTAREVALYGSDSDAIEFSRGMLRKNAPRPAPGRRITRLLKADRLASMLGDRLPGEVGIFGFNAGFMQHILPPGLNAPTSATPFADPYYTGDSHVLLDAHFALAEPAFMTEARKSWDSVTSADGEVAVRLKEAIDGRPGESTLLARQQSWDTLAAFLYRVGIPRATVYRGFNQEQYDRLLAWTSYSVMMNVANGYNGLSAYATRDAKLARQQITTSTLWWGFILTYVIGCMDGRTDSLPISDSLPRFLTANGGTCQ
ncbi:hypothetical protein [Mycobacterium intracellulare]|uniref:hypothetical protein n=1 Tax=Mycobacterium intracellulare TaxID=1767 RepID=UPI001EED7271|nr:hypothetical protein [Mycobacterium intracellulare]MEE3753122.1 hypothetical protein [Mycobacterium intracellulare]